MQNQEDIYAYTLLLLEYNCLEKSSFFVYLGRLY